MASGAVLFPLPFYILTEVEQDEPLIDIYLCRLVKAMRTPNLNRVLVKELGGGLDHPGQLLPNVLLTLPFRTGDTKLISTPFVVCQKS